MLGLYIHIPFCRNKCSYCAFCTTKNINDREDLFIRALENEMKIYKDQEIDAIYLGGGTPSVLKSESLYKIKENIDKNFKLNLKEFSIENNPEDINENYLKLLKDIGVNRLSIGCQTFDNDTLKILNRKHKKEDTINSIELAKKYFNNISIDLMLGLPNQTQEKIIEDIKIFNSLNLKHISVYGLKVEENTKLNYLVDNKLTSIPDDDFQADMYEKITEILKQKDIYRYEISNFSKKGYESLHNLKYWKREQYIGLGPSAHSLFDDKRYSNTENIQKYIKNGLENKFIYENEEIIDKKEQEKEKIILALRLKEGLNFKEYQNEFNQDFLKKYNSIINKYGKCLNISDTSISIKDEYIYSLNSILEEFIND